MKLERVTYTYSELCQEIPSLSNYAKTAISQGIKDGILNIIDIWAEKKSMSLFTIMAIPGDTVMFIFNRENIEKKTFETDEYKIVNLESPFTCSTIDTQNGLIKLKLEIEKHRDSGSDLRLYVIALSDIIYDDKIVFKKFQKIRFYSIRRQDEKITDKMYNVHEVILDVRPVCSFGLDFQSEKLLEFSSIIISNT